MRLRDEFDAVIHRHIPHPTFVMLIRDVRGQGPSQTWKLTKARVGHYTSMFYDLPVKYLMQDINQKNTYGKSPKKCDIHCGLKKTNNVMSRIFRFNSNKLYK